MTDIINCLTKLIIIIKLLLSNYLNLIIIVTKLIIIIEFTII